MRQPLSLSLGVLMRVRVLDELIRRLRATYGDSYSAWGTAPHEEEGTGFVIQGLPVYFSVMLAEGAPDKLDVQIDSNVEVPPNLGYDQYMYNGTHTITDLLVLVEQYRKPISFWPL